MQIQGANISFGTLKVISNGPTQLKEIWDGTGDFEGLRSATNDFGGSQIAENRQKDSFRSATIVGTPLNELKSYYALLRAGIPVEHLKLTVEAPKDEELKDRVKAGIEVFNTIA